MRDPDPGWKNELGGRVVSGSDFGLDSLSGGPTIGVVNVVPRCFVAGVRSMIVL